MRRHHMQQQAYVMQSERSEGGLQHGNLALPRRAGFGSALDRETASAGSSAHAGEEARTVIDSHTPARIVVRHACFFLTMTFPLMVRAQDRVAMLDLQFIADTGLTALDALYRRAGPGLRSVGHSPSV
jgi:hypothetical protein